MPASEGVARWSAAAAPSSAASSAPPDGASSSACEPEPQPVARGGLEDASRLVRAEHPVLAEDVAEPRPAVGGHPGELVLDHRPDVRLRAVGARAELGRDRVRAEVRRHDLDRALATELIRRLDQPDLGLEVEAVARLGLDGRDAVAEHLVEPAPAVGEQRLGRGLARRGHRRQDPAAGLEDLEIAGAALAHLPLALAGAREQEVRVRIDQAGRDRAAAGVEPREPSELVALRL